MVMQLSMSLKLRGKNQNAAAAREVCLTEYPSLSEFEDDVNIIRAHS